MPKKKKVRILHPFRETYLDRHHLKSKKRGGKGRYTNIIWFWRDKHEAWHKLYDHLTLDEVISLKGLETRGMKTILASRYDYKSWHILWGKKNTLQTLKILKRYKRVKLKIKASKKRKTVL